MNRLLPTLLCALTLGVCAFGCRAQTAANDLPQSQSLLADDALAKVKFQTIPTAMFDGEGQNFARALRVQVPQTAGDTNKVQVTIDNIAPIEKGDVLLATFAARGQGENANAGAQLMFLFERNSEPYTKSVTRGVTLPDAKAWRRVAIPFVAQETYAPGQAMTSLRLAFGAQTVEIADLQVRNFGSALTLQRMREVAAAMAPLGEIDVTVRATQTRQTMSGLGGNYTGGARGAWGQVNDHVAQYTRANLAPVHARLGLSLKLWQPDAGGAFVATGKTGEVLKMAGEFAARKVPLTVSIWEAPDWMTEQQGGKKIIPEAQWDAAVNAIATFLERARERGAIVENVSFNEPDLGIDIHWAPARMGAFIKRAVPEFRKRGLPAQWLTGDTANGAALVVYARPQLEDEELRPMLGPIAFHSWDALTASDASYREIAQLAAQYERPVWCLEAGSDAQAYQLNPRVWDSWNYALGVALAYAKTIGESRASVLDYWTYRDDFPLADKAGKPYPLAKVLGQIGGAFGPGTQVVEATLASADARVLAGVKADGTMVVLLVNSVGAGQVNLRGLKPNAAVTLTVSDESGQSVESPEQLKANEMGVVKVTLPTRSVVLVETR